MALLVRGWGKVLDEPVLFEDGTVRFHVTDGTALAGGATLVVPNPGVTTLFTDDFEAGRDDAWMDVWGTTAATGGKLSGTSGGETITVVDGIMAQDVVLNADMQIGQPFAFILRFTNSNNFILANYNPGANAIYIHERVNGNWGSPWNMVGTTGLYGNGLATASVSGNTVSLSLSDGATTVSTSYTLATLLGAGLFGVYTNGPTQQIDNFVASVPYVPVDVLADAVQVIVPASAAVPTANLPHQGDYIGVTGIAGKGLANGNMRAVIVREPADLSPAN
jgi:hypothetical protein